MPKAYLWEPSLVPTPAARFENLIALHMLKLCHFLVVLEGKRDFVENGIRCVPARQFLGALV